MECTNLGFAEGGADEVQAAGAGNGGNPASGNESNPADGNGSIPGTGVQSTENANDDHQDVDEADEAITEAESAEAALLAGEALVLPSDSENEVQAAGVGAAPSNPSSAPSASSSTGLTSAPLTSAPLASASPAISNETADHTASSSSSSSSVVATNSATNSFKTKVILVKLLKAKKLFEEVQKKCNQKQPEFTKMQRVTEYLYVGPFQPLLKRGEELVDHGITAVLSVTKSSPGSLPRSVKRWDSGGNRDNSIWITNMFD
jgi:hypothetical protein